VVEAIPDDPGRHPTGGMILLAHLVDAFRRRVPSVMDGQDALGL